jgi:hypothetical protein
MGSAFSGSAPGVGSSGGVGFLSPFDQSGVQTALGQSTQAMTNRYNQLGLGGSTPEAMDLGQAPSLTGGLPAEAQATLGDIQASDLSSTASSAGSAIQGKGQQVSGITNLASGVGGLLK